MLLLDPKTPPLETYFRLKAFEKLFAFRFSRAIITRPGQGPRAWTSLRGRLTPHHLVRHLLADRVPTLPPQWVGTRSFRASPYLCIDVDADRPALQRPRRVTAALQRRAHRSSLGPEKPRAGFAERCRWVEDALRRLGINPAFEDHVLIQATPSGGRHYYIFFDNNYVIFCYEELLRSAGLRHVPGQVEFFPSTSRGLRLPFGLIPGRPHDPRAWIQFIDDYSNGRIRRHKLEHLYDNLCAKAEARPSKPVIEHADRSGTERPRPGPSKADRMGWFRAQPRPLPGPGSLERYERLVEHGPRSPQEAEELMALGIRAPGTRMRVLKHLAAHLIWCRGIGEREAAEILIRWAMDPRHESIDIQADLAEGTNRVATQIAQLCRWYTSQKRPSEKTRRLSEDGEPRFALSELRTLGASVRSLPPEARTDQAHFLLSFLGFAKLHGRPAGDGSGWEAAPAIRQVVRRWPGCGHMDYKTRIESAVGAGMLILVREKWQRAGGGGRARTYRLAVPVVDRRDWTIAYAEALAILTDPAGDRATLVQPGAAIEGERPRSPSAEGGSRVGGRKPDRSSGSIGMGKEEAAEFCTRCYREQARRRASGLPPLSDREFERMFG